MRVVILLIAATLASQAVASEMQEMGCKNPRRPYLVVFDEKAKTFTIDPDTDAVRYSGKDVNGLTVSGDVGHDSGLTFVASFAHPRSLKFYSADGSLFQTDECEN